MEPAPKKQKLSSPPRSEEQKMDTSEEQKMDTSEEQKMDTSEEQKMDTSEEQKLQASQQQPANDMESDLPIRGRDSKNLCLRKQQKRCQLKPELNHGVSLSNAGGSNKIRLFGRCLEIYEENTPLYPMCRAWMANQPYNPAVSSFKTNRFVPTPKRSKSGEEVLAGLRSGEIEVLTNLPAPRDTDLPMIPPRLELGQEEGLEGASHSELLTANVKRWTKVRDHWLKHTKEYQQQRFGVIDQIMLEADKRNSK